jgi:hypothetical protein
MDGLDPGRDIPDAPHLWTLSGGHTNGARDRRYALIRSRFGSYIGSSDTDTG